MAKAFDLIHKVNTDSGDDKSRIPFEDEDKDGEEQKPKRRPRLEMAFFYVLLFIIFFFMGSTLVSPTFFGTFGQGKTATISPTPTGSPQQGLVIDKEGQKTEETAKELGIVASPTPTVSATAKPAVATSTQPEPTETKSAAASVQVLNGTSREGAAGALRTKLANKGIVVASIGNYGKAAKQTTVYYDTAYKTAAQQVQAVTGGVLINLESATGKYDVLVVIGAR